MPSTSDPLAEQGPALPLPDRERVLEHAAELIDAAWRSFDHPRPGQPLPDAHTRELLSRPLPAAPSDPAKSLDAAADVLDRSLIANNSGVIARGRLRLLRRAVDLSLIHI